MTPPSPSPPRLQKQNRLTPARAAALVADYEAGASIADVARKYRVHVNTATRHVTTHGLTIRHPHAVPQEDLEIARALYNAGWTYAQIGMKYGCSRTTVSNQLNGRI
jgi:uncharacterized protein YjcR